MYLEKTHKSFLYGCQDSVSKNVRVLNCTLVFCFNIIPSRQKEWSLIIIESIFLFLLNLKKILFMTRFHRSREITSSNYQYLNWNLWLCLSACFLSSSKFVYLFLSYLVPPVVIIISLYWRHILYLRTIPTHNYNGTNYILQCCFYWLTFLVGLLCRLACNHFRCCDIPFQLMEWISISVYFT